MNRKYGIGFLLGFIILVSLFVMAYRISYNRALDKHNQQNKQLSEEVTETELCYYIKDVVVRPEYQKQGIGRMLIDELLNFIKGNGVSGTDIFVELCAMPDKIPFYEKFGFSANEAQRLRKMYRVD